MTIATPLAATGGGRTPGWIRRRARNVYRRPLLAGGVASGVFVVALVALVVVPREAQRVAQATMPPPDAWRDTAAVLRRLALAEGSARAADSALVRGRAAVLGRAEDIAVDTLSPEVRARRDSLAAAVAELSQLLRRAADAPLAASYRALGTAPELRGMPRVAQLLDTLAEVEKSRASFGAAGGVDPIFVALTTRATQVGKSIQDIAEARRAALRRELERLTPPVRTTSAADTLPLAQARDSAALAVAALRRELGDARVVNQALDERAARARAAASVGASVPSMLAASLVLGLAVGFGVTFALELRHPRLADRGEAESIAGVPVLVTIEEPPSVPDRNRRRVDHEVPRLIDQFSDAYRLLYTQLADRSFDLPLITIVGDDPTVTAVVAANLAATIARQVRTTILVDTDVGGRSVVDVVRVRQTPGLADVLVGRAEWSEALASVTVGRGRSMDVLPAGVAPRADVAEALGSGAFTSLLEHLARRYECVVVSAPVSRHGGMPPLGNGGGHVVLCARTARTPVGALERLAAALRERSASLRGVVVWDRGDPIV